MIYRLATAGDSERLAELIWEHVDEESPLDINEKAAYVQNCAEHIEHRLGFDLCCWVAEYGSIIVAHIYIITSQKVPKPGRMNRVSGRLSTVRTIPEYRNKRVGSALMDRVVAWCREQDLEELIVCPSERSIPFYERAGFKNENDVMELLFE